MTVPSVASFMVRSIVGLPSFFYQPYTNPHIPLPIIHPPPLPLQKINETHHLKWYEYCFCNGGVFPRSWTFACMIWSTRLLVSLHSCVPETAQGAIHGPSGHWLHLENWRSVNQCVKGKPLRDLLLAAAIMETNMACTYITFIGHKDVLLELEDVPWAFSSAIFPSKCLVHRNWLHSNLVHRN